MDSTQREDRDPLRILVVDDQRGVADLYAAWLGAELEVTVAYDGEAALEAIDESVDVVFLDRRMPGMTGDEVLAALAERDPDPYVAFVTGVEPDIDILDAPIDEYLHKPVSKADLEAVIRDARICATFGEDMRRHNALTNKRDALEDALPARDESRTDQLRTVIEQLERLTETSGAEGGESAPVGSNESSARGPSRVD